MAMKWTDRVDACHEASISQDSVVYRLQTIAQLLQQTVRQTIKLFPRDPSGHAPLVISPPRQLSLPFYTVQNILTATTTIRQSTI